MAARNVHLPLMSAQIRSPTLLSGASPASLTVNASALTTLVVVANELLPGVASEVVEAAVAALVMTVPWIVPTVTLTTIVNAAVPPGGALGLENTTLPVPPAGTASVRVQPADEVEAETSVVFAGTAS